MRILKEQRKKDKIIEICGITTLRTFIILILAILEKEEEELEASFAAIRNQKIEGALHNRIPNLSCKKSVTTTMPSVIPVKENCAVIRKS